MQKQSKTTDLTQGKIAPQLIAFAIPIFIGQLFQSLYNSVDSIVVGRFVGTTALAAVASSSDIASMLVAFFTGLSAGSGVLFSRFFGAKDYKNLHDAIHTALLFAVLIGVAMSAVGIFLTPWLLQLVSCPADVFPEAVTYLRIYFIGILFTSTYNVGSGVLRAVGDSRDPLNYLIIASVINIVLDLLFVCAFRMGVMGVALATVISQLVSLVLVFYNMLTTKDVYRLRITDLRLDPRLMGQIVSLGLPAALQTCLVGVSNLFIQKYINMAGSAAMAGMGAAKKMDRFVGIIANSLGLALTTFVGQNMGAENPHRAYKGIRVCLVIGMVAIAVIGIPVYFFAGTVLKIFTTDEAALFYGINMVHVMMPLYYLQLSNHIFPNAVRGFGKSFLVMMLSLIGMVGLRQLFLNLSIYVLGMDIVTTVYYSYPVGWGCAGLLSLIYYLVVIKRKYPDRKLQQT